MMHGGIGFSGSSSSSSSSSLGCGGSLGLKHGEWPKRVRRLRLLFTGCPVCSATEAWTLGVSSLLPLFLSSTARFAMVCKLGAASDTSRVVLQESL